MDFIHKTNANLQWIVADMDGTLLPTPTKAGGHYLPVTEARCFDPLVKWIENGKSVCVVTTAGLRSFRQVFLPLRTALLRSPKSNFLICSHGGALLYYYDRETNRMVEDLEYRQSFHTTFDPAQQTTLEKLCQKIVLSFFAATSSDPSLLRLLSTKYQQPYSDILEQFPDQESREKELTIPNLVLKGKYMKATCDSLIDIGYIPSFLPPEDGIDFRQTVQISQEVIQMNFLGIPMVKYRNFVPNEIEEKFHEMGIIPHSQPNSVCLLKKGISKATVVQYLISQSKFPFQLDQALAFGDSPSGPDLPLSLSPPMHFICLWSKKHDPHENSTCIGGEEEGTAKYLSSLTEILLKS